jgi:hypothetical protein
MGEKMIENEIKNVYLYEGEIRKFEIIVPIGTTNVKIQIAQLEDKSYSWITTDIGTNSERSAALDIAHLDYHFNNWELRREDFTGTHNASGYSVFYKGIFIHGARTLKPSRNTKNNRKFYSNQIKYTIEDFLNCRLSDYDKNNLKAAILKVNE